MPDLPPDIVSLDDPIAQASATEPPQKTFQDAPYDPSKDREGVRSTIALSLIALLAVVVVVPFVLILLGVGCDALGPGSDICRRIPVVTLKDVLETVLTPMVGLVGAVTGFYFGDSKGRP